MKKILIPLTGIVFVIAILAAGGCRGNKNQNGSTEAGTQEMITIDTTTVYIYLKDTLIDGKEHLEMYDSKKPHDVVIDSLYTKVNPGDTVIFMKAHKSEVKKVKNVRLVEKVFDIYSIEFRVDSGLYVLIIDPEAPVGETAKYEIYFTVKQDTTTHFVDPYLELPK